MQQTAPPPITPAAPRAISRPKRHALRWLLEILCPNKLKVLTGQLGRAAEGTAMDKDLSVGMLKDRRSKDEDLSSAVVKDRYHPLRPE